MVLYEMNSNTLILGELIHNKLCFEHMKMIFIFKKFIRSPATLIFCTLNKES